MKLKFGIPAFLLVSTIIWTMGFMGWVRVPPSNGATNTFQVYVDVREVQLLGPNGSAEVTVVQRNKTNSFVRTRSYITLLRGGNRVSIDFTYPRTFNLGYNRGRPFWGRDLVPRQDRPDVFWFKFRDSGPRHICVVINVARIDADTEAKLPSRRGSDCFDVK